MSGEPLFLAVLPFFLFFYRLRILLSVHSVLPLFSIHVREVSEPPSATVYHFSGLLPSGMLRQLKRCFCDMISHFFRLLCTALVLTPVTIRFVKFYLPLNGNISLA